MKGMNSCVPIVSIIVFLAFTLHPLTSAGQSTLDRYLQTAAENNPQLKALFNQYLAALEEVTQVGSLPDPQLTFAAFVQPIETRVGAQRANFSVSQLFPWFGALTAQEQVASERAKAKLQQFEAAKLSLCNQVSDTYNELYYVDRSVEITQENLQLLASLKELARVNFEGGNAGFADVLQVEIQEEELKNQLQSLEESLNPLLRQLEQLLNTEFQEALNLPNSLEPEVLLLPKDSIFQNILEKHPRLQELQYEEQAYANQATAANKMGAPSLIVGGSYTLISPRTDMEVMENGRDAILFPQVGLRLPIYRKRYQAMEKQAQLQQQAISLMQESTQDRLRTELEKLYTDYQDATRRVKLNRRLAELAQRTLNLLQTEFSAGEASFDEILSVERQLLNYKLNFLRAQVDQNKHVYSIRYLMGQS